MEMQTMIDTLGLDAYDTALPLDWFEKACGIAGAFEKKSNVNISTHVVWCYDGAVFGYPVGLTELGRKVVGTMATS